MLEQIGTRVFVVRVNAVTGDTYSTIWRKVFAELTYTQQRRKIGFSAEVETCIRSVNDEIVARDVVADDVRSILVAVGAGPVLIVLIDEYDLIADKMGTSFSDTIKMLSDHSVPATLVLIGVSDTVEKLIQQHESIERALAQVRMQRMSEGEIREIVRVGRQEA